MKTYLTITVDISLYQKIEQLRGREKRSTFVEHLIQLGIKEHNNHIQGEDLRKKGVNLR